jgi:DNA-binding transcriptional LysR family regulator
VLAELAKNGGGILARPRWSVERELDDGSLVEIDLADTLVSETAIFAVYPASRYLPRRIRLWIDNLAAEFRSEPNLK